MGPTDEEIARKIQRGENNEVFGILVERYESKMTRYARKFFSNGDDVKDIVQEIFIKAYTNIQSFDASRRFSPWLYRIAHNELVNLVRKKSKQPFFSFDMDALFPHLAAKETADADINAREIKEAISRTLNKLDLKYREPLALYYVEELSYQEIADVLEIPVATVGVRISRGKSKLKKLYEDNFGKYER